MKILIATMPADGHFNPLTGVALDLQSHGHNVRWYAGPQYQPKLESLGLSVFPYDRATEITGENIQELFPERAKLRGPKRISFDSEKFFIANVEHHYRDIVDIHESFPFDAFLCDAALYVQKLVAEKLGVPVYSIVPGPLMATKELPPPFFGLRPPKTVVGALVHRAVQAMLDSTLRRGVQTYNEILAAEGISPISVDRFLDVSLGCARRIFLVGAPGLDFPQLRVPERAEFVGALVPARRSAVAETTLPAIARNTRATVVAVSQGTVDNDDPRKVIIPTLDAYKNNPDVVVVATTGGKNTERLRQSYPQPNLVIEDFLPYEELFPLVDVFVTNGGFGSVLAALSRGIPVVCAGKREGKNDINARVDYNGLGVDLRTEHPRARKIAASVRRVIADQQFTDNVARVKTELASYEPLTIIRRRIEDDAEVDKQLATRQSGDSSS